MTEWQWKVVIQLCKVVIKLVSYHTVGYTGGLDWTDTQLLEEAIERETK